MNNSRIKKKLCIVCSVPFALNVFMLNHIIYLSNYYDIHVVTNGIKDDLKSEIKDLVNFKKISISRKINLFQDFISLIHLFIYFSRNNFDFVHSFTPKAGLIAMLVSKFCNVNHRIHTFTGQVWANKVGINRYFLKYFDILIASHASKILVDSPSQLEFLIQNNVLNHQSDARVLANGSFSGVDLNRFRLNLNNKIHFRAKFGIDDQDIIFIYVGRMSEDKGIRDLLSAFQILSNENNKVHLLLVGPDEIFITPAIEEMKMSGLNIYNFQYTNEPEYYMSAADVLVLPSYREGFGAVLIEAAAIGLPVIASRIYGIVDAVIDGETGILHEPGCVPEIIAAMKFFCCKSNLNPFISSAIVHASTKFDSRILTKYLHAFYEELN